MNVIEKNIVAVFTIFKFFIFLKIICSNYLSNYVTIFSFSGSIPRKFRVQRFKGKEFYHSKATEYFYSIIIPTSIFSIKFNEKKMFFKGGQIYCQIKSPFYTNITIKAVRCNGHVSKELGLLFKFYFSIPNVLVCLILRKVQKKD